VGACSARDYPGLGYVVRSSACAQVNAEYPPLRPSAQVYRQTSRHRHGGRDHPVASRARPMQAESFHVFYTGRRVTFAGTIAAREALIASGWVAYREGAACFSWGAEWSGD